MPEPNDKSPRLWVDADACPREVRELVFRAAARRGLRVTLVANAWQNVPPVSGVDLVVVASGDDKADDHIVAAAHRTDLVVTGDVPLAARIVAKGLTAVSPRGEEYTEATIGERLAGRDLMEALRGAGLATGGPAPFSEKDVRQFANVLDRYITRWRPPPDPNDA